MKVIIVKVYLVNKQTFSAKVITWIKVRFCSILAFTLIMDMKGG